MDGIERTLLAARENDAAADLRVALASAGFTVGTRHGNSFNIQIAGEDGFTVTVNGEEAA